MEQQLVGLRRVQNIGLAVGWPVVDDSVSHS